ncbi:MAG: beta-N-acetylhexosaminidase, partial [Actinomycetota bacterium]|nr:beta-N-acetylhexosaminidase [Actinomycetota bacterium]
DQEGGIVQRIKDGVDAVASQADTATGTLPEARCTYYRLGTQLRALGVNQDYAPVADVIREPQDVIGTRSFGTDPARDAAFVRAAVTGLQSAGVLATVKHWPGHGNTLTDSHAALAVLHQDATSWRRVDRRPFAAAAGEVAAVMVGHLALPALDPSMRPATLSPVLVRGQLRKVLGFRGLVVTDSMWMQPVRAAGDPAQAAVLALRAGDDMLLMSPDVPGASRALLARVQRSPRVRAMVQAAVRYVLAAKARIGNQPGPDLCSS